MIALFDILTMLFGWIITGKLVSGMYIGAGVFLAWAFSRELDPAHDYSAFLAAALSLSNVFFYKNIQLLVLFWILLLMRILNEISGKERTTFDVFSVLILSLYLSITNQNSIYLLIFALAMSMAIKLNGKSKLLILALGISSIGFIGESFFMKYFSFTPLTISLPLYILTLFISLLSFFLFSILSREEIKDDKGNKVKRKNVFASQMMFPISFLLLFFFNGLHINTLIIYLSVLLGVGLYFTGSKLFRAN